MSIIKGKGKYLMAAVCLIVFTVIFIRLAQSGYAQSTHKTYLELVKEDKLYYNEHPSFEDELRDAPESAKKQLDSWERAVAKLKGRLPVEDWKLISSGDIDLHFTNFLPSQEVATFNSVFYGDERKAALEIGDLFPGALISPNQDQVILLWEKGDGSTAYIQMDSKTDLDGNRTWDLNGKANIIEKNVK